MLRKLQENIFPDVGGQVDNIVGDRSGVFALEGDMGLEIRQIDRAGKGFKAAYAMALERKSKTPLDQQPTLKLLHLKIILQWLFESNDLVTRVDIQFFDRQFSRK